MTKKPLIIITGSSSGIGAAMAKIFSEANYPVGLFSRNKSAMENLNLHNSICISVDVTDIHAMKEAIQLAESRFGETDCLINNAGFAKLGDFTEISHDDNERMIDLNILGVINGIEAILPGMRERHSGTIINVSSVADRNSRPNGATYAATKAAVKSLSESLRMANAKYGIRICNLAPAKIITPLLHQVDPNADPKQMIDAEELARAALWMYEQPKNICVRDLVFAPTYYEP